MHIESAFYTFAKCPACFDAGAVTSWPFSEWGFLDEQLNSRLPNHPSPFLQGTRHQAKSRANHNQSPRFTCSSSLLVHLSGDAGPRALSSTCPPRPTTSTPQPTPPLHLPTAKNTMKRSDKSSSQVRQWGPRFQEPHQELPRMAGPTIVAEPEPETEVPPRVDHVRSSSGGICQAGGEGSSGEEKGEGDEEEGRSRFWCCSRRLIHNLSDVMSEEDEAEADESDGSGRSHRADVCLNHHLIGFLASVLAWYCFGLSFFVAPMGPTAHVPLPDQARNAHRATPAAFYLLFAGRFCGASIFGQFGDHHGRRMALALSLLLVGLTTLAMGLFPFHEPDGDGLSVGWAAVRFLQGIGVGGQWPGTILLALESCHNEKHGALAAGISHSGIFLGLGLAAGAAYQLMGQDGGGIPMRAAFWIGGCLLLPTSVWAYCGDGEAETFEEVQLMGDMERWPCWAVVKQRFWALLFGWTTLLIDALTQSLLIFQWPLILPHGSGPGPHGNQPVNDSPAASAKDVHGCVAMGLLAAAVMTIFSAFLRERSFSRCLLYRLGALLTCLGTWIWFVLAAGTVRRHKPLAWLFGGYLFVLGPGLGTMQGPLAALLAEPFPTSIAYAGLGMIYHTIHAAIGAAFPSLAKWLLGRGSETVLTLGGDIRPIYLAVTILIVTVLCMFTTSFLKGYRQQPSLTRTRGLRVRDCVALSTNPPSSIFRPDLIPVPCAHSMPLPTLQQQGQELPRLEEETKH